MCQMMLTLIQEEMSKNIGDLKINEKLLQEMCEKPTPLGVGWIAQIMCM